MHEQSVRFRFYYDLIPILTIILFRPTNEGNISHQSIIMKDIFFVAITEFKSGLAPKKKIKSGQ